VALARGVRVRSNAPPVPWHARAVLLHRREVLATFGVASASTLLLALGCGAPAPIVRRAPQVSGEVRTWLHDAVARLAAAYPFAHALAVSRRRTAAASDVLGAGIARLYAEGVVFTVRDRGGTWHEHASSELSRDAIAAAARALDAARQPRAVDFGPPPAAPAEPPALDDRDLRARVELLLHGDAALARRLVYAAAALDIDDAVVWSVAPGRDLEQRLVRIRQTAVRAAWNGTRPVVREVERAWSGGLDDQPLTPDDLTAASEAALEVLTPGGFDDGERPVVLDPSVVAVVLDAAARGLFTADAARRPEVARRLADAAPLASPLVTIIDDPTTPGAYGGFAFDDEGEPAAPLTLLDAGRVAAPLSDRAAGAPGRGRRPGHLGRVTPSPSHLRLAPGPADLRQLHSEGFILEGGLGARLDPGGDRIRVACTRARELRAGNTTGRLYADVELVGSLPALLSAVDAVAATPASFVPRDPAGRHPTWRSISAPALRTRGLVRASRSRT
jgi:predicted Zn-dependent protease